MKKLLLLAFVGLSLFGQRELTRTERDQRWFSIVVPTAGLSEGINISSCTMLSIEHGTWTAAVMSFQVSVDGTNYTDLYEESTEVTIGLTTTAQTVRLIPSNWWFVKFIKFRSGTSASVVTQGETRTLKVGCR